MWFFCDQLTVFSFTVRPENVFLLNAFQWLVICVTLYLELIGTFLDCSNQHSYISKILFKFCFHSTKPPISVILISSPFLKFSSWYKLEVFIYYFSKKKVNPATFLEPACMVFLCNITNSFFHYRGSNLF